MRETIIWTELGSELTWTGWNEILPNRKMERLMFLRFFLACFPMSDKDFITDQLDKRRVTRGKNVIREGNSIPSVRSWVTEKIARWSQWQQFEARVNSSNGFAVALPLPRPFHSQLDWKEKRESWSRKENLFPRNWRHLSTNFDLLFVKSIDPSFRFRFFAFASLWY